MKDLATLTLVLNFVAATALADFSPAQMYHSGTPPTPSSPSVESNRRPARKPDRPSRQMPRPPRNCESEYRSQLGDLACVACGLEEYAPAQSNAGHGFSNWIKLLGVVAQDGYGPYDLSDPRKRQEFQQRVSEMVASYGYCTNEEYPKSIEIQRARRLFLERNPSEAWNARNVQGRQWRFRSMLKTHGHKGVAPDFAPCAQALEGRLSGDGEDLKLCGVKKNQHQPEILPEEIKRNSLLYSTVIHRCKRIAHEGANWERRMPSLTCDYQCWTNFAAIGTTPCLAAPRGDNEPSNNGDNRLGGKGAEPGGDRNRGGDESRGTR